MPTVSPPVIVTPAIVIVGSRGAPGVPSVSTGPPPLMIVEDAPVPISRRLLSMLTPPAKVPDAIRIARSDRARRPLLERAAQA